MLRFRACVRRSLYSKENLKASERITGRRMLSMSGKRMRNVFLVSRSLRDILQCEPIYTSIEGQMSRHIILSFEGQEVWLWSQ